MSSKANVSGIEKNMLEFLRGKEKDNKGRYLFDYWKADNQWLEETHNYIQWMFPLDMRSFHHPFVAPALKVHELEIVKNDEIIQDNMIMSFQRMLEFYGLQVNEVENKIEKNDIFEERSKVWLSVGNHNHLRLTRIIKSMRLLRVESYAEMLLDFLIELVSEENCFTKGTRSIWIELKNKNSLLLSDIEKIKGCVFVISFVLSMVIAVITMPWFITLTSFVCNELLRVYEGVFCHIVIAMGMFIYNFLYPVLAICVITLLLCNITEKVLYFICGRR